MDLSMDTTVSVAARGIKTPFGRELERLRKERKLTQQSVANTIGVTLQAYQNWIHGRRGKKISVEFLKRLALTLDTDFEQLGRLIRPDLDFAFERLSIDGPARGQLVSITARESRVLAEVLRSMRGEDVNLDNKSGFIIENNEKEKQDMEMKKKTYRPMPMLGGENVLVDTDIDIELEIMLFAAIKAYQAGLKGVDRLLKMHKESWRRQIEAARKETESSIH